MSQYLQINSLLNIGEARSDAAPDVEAANNRSEALSQPALSSSGVPHGPVHPTANLALPSILRANDTHAVRDQPIYTTNDYRYWPYTRHGTPHQMPLSRLYTSSPFPQPSDAYLDPRRELMPWHRQRRTRACQNCHVKKVKCEGDGVRCFNCVRANIECRWIPMKKRGPKPKPKSASGSLPASSRGSAVQLPKINEPSESIPKDSVEGPVYNGLGLGLGLGLGSSTASRSHNSRATSATATTASPRIASHIQYPSRSVSSSHCPAAPAESFYRTVTESQGGDMNAGSIAETLRRFYSDEVSEETRNSVIYYFEYFYAICPIFHPALFVRRIVDGEVDQILIDSMRASAARIINRNTGSNIDLDRLIEETDTKLLSYLAKPSVDYVRAVVIMASLNGGECRFVMYNALTCLAASLVNRLGWHMIDMLPTSPDITWREWISIEIKRRTFYVVFQIDAYLSVVSDRSMTVTTERSIVLVPGSGVWWDNLTDPEITDKLPVRCNNDISNEEIIKKGSLVHTFVDMCSLNVIISRINNMLWDFKLGLPTYPHGEDFRPNIKFFKGYVPDTYNVVLPIRSLFDIDEFRSSNEALKEWRRNLVRASDMKDIGNANRTFETFGNHAHRIHQMRIRYFCLYTYSVPIMHCLHFSNRPSYFATQSANKVFVDTPDVASLILTDAPENKAIYEILSNVFTERLNRGLLAYDIINDSWRECVQVVYDLVQHLDLNRDIPLERYDQVMPFCLLTSMTVLIRNARIIKHKVETGEVSAEDVHDDLDQSTMALRRLWTLLGDLNHVWRVEGVEYLMRIMQVEEMVNATDLLSGLSL
ncbi:hypothetical protein J3B01_001538 [Coemansia erecta]|nr:hypothetical protein J3B01_001538 [Coemansia erecta]